MTTLNRSTTRIQVFVIVFVTMGMTLLSTAPIAEETPKPKKSGETAAKPEKKPAKTLTGAELYAINCNRCHLERSSRRGESQEKVTEIGADAGGRCIVLNVAFIRGV